jgi:hypothetical protein
MVPGSIVPDLIGNQERTVISSGEQQVSHYNAKSDG